MTKEMHKVNDDEIEKNNLEEKVSWGTRLKFMAVPGIATISAAFIPELKKSYANLTPITRERIEKYGLSLTGGAVAALGIYTVVNAIHNSSKQNTQENSTDENYKK